MKFENTSVFNFDNALRGMRNPKNSWNNGDTRIYTYVNAIHPLSSFDPTKYQVCSYSGTDAICVEIGPKDMKLAQTLIKSGPEHRKFLRQIFVSVDITAPLYFWKELDTYKVGTVANSTSTMHKLTANPITLDCFEIDDYEPKLTEEIETGLNENGEITTINFCESLRQKYIETKDKKYWKELIRWLPESWLQMRTVTLNYENLLSICSKSQRRNHKLNEWSGKDNNKLNNFIKWARTLPYAQEFIFLDEKSEISESLLEISMAFASCDLDLISRTLAPFNISLKDENGYRNLYDIILDVNKAVDKKEKI